MASNPYFNNNPLFNGKAQRNQQGQPQGTAVMDNYSAGHAATQAISAQQLQQAYNVPSPTDYNVSSRMTYDDVIVKTGGLLALVISVAVVTWIAVPNNLLLAITIAGAVIGLILGLVNAFRKQPSPMLITLYALAQGVFMGGLSKVFELEFPGVVSQAVLATGVTFAVTLALYKSGKVRATPKMKRYLMIAMLSYGAFCLVNLGVMFFGTNTSAFGMRTSVEIAGIPLGVIIGIAAVLMGVFSLIIDFDFVQRGVEAGAPSKYSWAAGFGILVTLIWLYVEFLRLFAILASNR